MNFADSNILNNFIVFEILLVKIEKTEFLLSFSGGTKYLKKKNTILVFIWLTLSSIDKCLWPKFVQWTNICLTHLMHLMPLSLLYPLKTSENQRFSDVYKGYRNRLVASNGLMHEINPMA